MPVVTSGNVSLGNLSTGLEAVGGVLVLVIGYGACFALWHFVFSPRNRHDDDVDAGRAPERRD